jgi:hypothetical protein
VRAGEEVVLPPERDVAQLLLAQVVVQAHAPVGDEPGQRRPVVERVGRGLREVRARRLTGVRADEPALEALKDRWGTLLPECGPRLRRQLARVGQVLDPVEPADQL